MKTKFISLLCLVSGGLLVAAVIPDEDWGYVDVRPQAHMFWWFYGCTDNSQPKDAFPLVMWLQGGPGGSSTGFGNFKEIGPLDVSLKPRNTSWTQAANVLFVDNPVGTGYSYVDAESAYTTNVDEIAVDLVTLLRGFLNKRPDFNGLPFYIFCESYGGKMTSAFALALLKEIKAKNVTVNFRGVALGDSWISPIDYVNYWGPYLFATSLVSEAGLARIQSSAKQCQDELDKGNFVESTNLWQKTEDVVELVTDYVNFYNILLHNNEESSPLKRSHSEYHPRILKGYHEDALSALMNGPIKKKLGIPQHVIWGGQSGEVFTKQAGDFMKDVIGTVDELLSMGLNVTVYNGQLDLICCTQGTIAWMDKLKWSGLSRFKAAKRYPVYPDTDPTKKHTGGFYQAYENLGFYWILNAGHMVPADNGDTALSMVRRIISG